MLLKNLSAKVIGVGAKVLMPEGMDGDSMEVTDEIADLPAIKAFEARGLLRIIHEKKPPKPKSASAGKKPPVQKPYVPKEDELPPGEKPVKRAQKKSDEAE